jgi:hypothetical protein
MKRREIVTAVGAVVLASGKDAFAQTPSEPHPPKYKAF